MHKNNIAHRNINPNSVMLTKNLTVKLTNMGQSKYLQVKSHSITGQIEYIPPEMISGDGYDSKSADIY